jgi:hypothetical protein
MGQLGGPHIPFRRIDPDEEADRLAALRSGVPVTETAGEPAEITCAPVAVSKLAADAAKFSTAGYVLLKMGSVLHMGNSPGVVLTFEVHDSGRVLAPDGWEAVIKDGLITGAKRTGTPSPDAHLRRWNGWAKSYGEYPR